jgi:hypothetical protein
MERNNPIHRRQTMYGMTTYEPLHYMLAYHHHENCSHLASAKPGKRIKARVYHELDTSKTLIYAQGTRSENGREFRVEVTTPGGQQDFYDLDFQDVIRQIYP